MTLVISDISPGTSRHEIERVVMGLPGPLSMTETSPGMYQVEFENNDDAYDAYISLNGRGFNGYPHSVVYIPNPDLSGGNSIIVSGMSYTVFPIDVENAFGRFGKIEATPLGEDTWRITYPDAALARNAMEGMNGAQVYGKKVRVTIEHQAPAVAPESQEDVMDLNITGILHLKDGGSIEIAPTTVRIPILFKR